MLAIATLLAAIATAHLLTLLGTRNPTEVEAEPSTQCDPDTLDPPGNRGSSALRSAPSVLFPEARSAADFVVNVRNADGLDVRPMGLIKLILVPRDGRSREHVLRHSRNVIYGIDESSKFELARDAGRWTTDAMSERIGDVAVDWNERIADITIGEWIPMTLRPPDDAPRLVITRLAWRHARVGDWAEHEFTLDSIAPGAVAIAIPRQPRRWVWVWTGRTNDHDVHGWLDSETLTARGGPGQPVQQVRILRITQER